MAISDSTRRKLETLIDEHCRVLTRSEHGAWAARAGRAHTVLPIYHSLGGFWGVATDGRVIEVGEDDDSAREVTNVGLVRGILLRAANKHAELAELMPVRPAAARDCESCAFIREANRAGGDIICGCGGVGWICDDD